MYFLFRVFLTLAHLLYGFVQVTRLHLKIITQKLYKFFRRNEDIKGIVTVLNEKYKYKKIPNHFALILGYEEPSISDLIRILTWCLISGIPYVTFYDNNGCLRKQEEHIKREFLKCKPEFEEHIEWIPEPSMKTIKNGTNGIKHKTRIQCMSYEDGKGKIVTITQDLAKAVKIGSIQVEEINIEFLDSRLNPEKIPEPDLAIVCGETLSTYGFLPWHTRITEFYSLSTHHSISVLELANVLKNYNMSEQRYGK